jgi:isopenicillin N synthase-like dioxygenase
MGLPHSDPGVLTVLAQDAIGGLQVKQSDDDGSSRWVDVKPVPGALVINVGDLLQVQFYCLLLYFGKVSRQSSI